MYKSYFFFAMVMGPALTAQHPALGRNFTIADLSDDFETPWTFNYVSASAPDAWGISSNGEWSGMLRHAPENITFVPTPAGGESGSLTSLALSTIDNNNDPHPTQEDFGYPKFGTAGSNYAPGFIPVSERPLVSSKIFVPDFSTFDVDTGYDFGLRTAGTGVGFPGPGGEVYPSLWLDYNHGANRLDVFLRTPTQFTHSDAFVGSLASSGWLTLGIGYEANGFANYYVADGAVDLTPADLVFSTSAVPNAPLITELKYDFYSMTSPTNKNAPNETWIIDSHRVQIVPEPSAALLGSVLLSCVVLGGRRRRRGRSSTHPFVCG